MLRQTASSVAGLPSRSRRGRRDHIADRIHEEGVGLAPAFHRHAHAAAAGLGLGQGQVPAHVDHRDDAAAQVDQAAHFRRPARHGGDLVGDQDVLNPGHRHAEQLAGDGEGHEGHPRRLRCGWRWKQGSRCS